MLFFIIELLMVETTLHFYAYQILSWMMKLLEGLTVKNDEGFSSIEMVLALLHPT